MKNLLINILFYNRISFKNVNATVLIDSPFVKKHAPISIYYKRNSEKINLLKIYLKNKLK